MMQQRAVHDSEVRRLIAVWNALAPPLRPSPSDVELFAQSLEKWDEPRIMVQGATPELVDLALRNNAKRAIAMDYSISSLTAMQQLACEDWSRLEYYQNDWRVFAPELEGTVDAVLGDGTLTMLDFPKEWEDVIRNFKRYLVQGGRLVLRLGFLAEEPFHIDSYIRSLLSNVASRSARAEPEERRRMLREMVSEARIAFGIASAEANGVVNPSLRAEMVSLFHNDCEARFACFKEWESVRPGIPSPLDVWKENRSGKSFPPWEETADLLQVCGFYIKSIQGSGTRPFPGAMRLLVAERD